MDIPVLGEPKQAHRKSPSLRILLLASRVGPSILGPSQKLDVEIAIAQVGEVAKHQLRVSLIPLAVCYVACVSGTLPNPVSLPRDGQRLGFSVSHGLCHLFRA